MQKNEAKIPDIEINYEDIIFNLTSSIKKLEERMKNEINCKNKTLKNKITSLEKENASLKERMIKQEDKIKHHTQQNEKIISEIDNNYEGTALNLSLSIQKIEEQMKLIKIIIY